VISWAVSSVRGRVIVSVVHRVDSLVVHCLFTRSHNDKLSSSRILREDRATQLATRVTKACAYHHLHQVTQRQSYQVRGSYEKIRPHNLLHALQRRVHFTCLQYEESAKLPINDYIRDDTLLKVSITDPWYANIINYIAIFYQGWTRERLSEVADYTSGMTRICIRCALMAY
jgi:hypothetical protein